MAVSSSEFMKNFFFSIPDIGELSPPALATSYAQYCYAHRADIASMVESSSSVLHAAILDDTTPLSFITTRSALVSDITAITHRSKHEQEVGTNFVGQVWYGQKAVHHYRVMNALFKCPDPSELGTWLIATRPLLEDGACFYVPFFGWRVPSNLNESYEADHSVNEILIHNRRALDKLGSKKLFKTGLIRPVLSLDLPVLERIDLSTFSKITLDEREPFINFRNFLQARLLDIDTSRGSNSYEKDIKRLSLEIADSVRKLDSEMEKMSVKGWFQATGAVVATCTAFLVALDQPTLASLAGVGGGGGALWLVTKTMQEIMSTQRDLRDSPVFYLWLLSNSVRKR